ncbi:MAG TPA: glycosyltransferase, partial [Actinomycetota bacterium]|nr:glycosyltransferase [Actinomycetota bacterium]
PANYLRARRLVRGRLREGPYDLVHAHFGQAGLAVIPSRLPLVVTLYGSDVEGIVGPRGSYTVRGAILSRLSRVVARLADEVIVVSSSLGRRLPRNVSTTVIPTAVDLEVFRPGSREQARAELGLDPDKTLVLFAGRPEVPVKRYDVARRAVDRLAETHPAELVTIAGLPPSGVATHMRACDALLLTSRHEGAPTMIKEALAVRLPVVSVDVGDVRATIGDVPGCVVAQDSIEALSGSLAEVVGKRIDPGIDLTDRLDQSRQAEKIVDVYRRALRGVGGRATTR